MQYFAHKNDEKKIKQTIIEHSDGTAIYAEKFAKEFTDGILGKILGQYHDIGKYSKEFQNYLEYGGIRGSVDHSGAGSKEFFQYGIMSKNSTFFLLSLCIAGHHGGLPDIGNNVQTLEKGTLLYRLKNSNLPDYSSFKCFTPEIKFNLIPDITQKLTTAFSQMFYTRMLYSCLVDADYIDTENFISQGTVIRSSFESLEKMKQKLDVETAKFFPPKSKINELRCKLLQQCQNVGSNIEQKDKNLYTLTIPTGGGKTLASLSFALNKAVLTSRNRIIYVIPYTSIIEQNADVFKNNVGEKNVIEHHINVEYDDNDGNNPKKLATENWDAPLIVTTNVQFFESLFANKPSKCRKLHNIANSVIIFDEAQMLPIDYLLPCTEIIKELTEHYNCCVVLCTATQPSLNKFFDNKPIEIIDNPKLYYNALKRTTIKVLGNRTESELAALLKEHRQVLCIVGTKRKAQEIFNLLKDEVGIYHLSTNMYPAHRKRVLEEIRQKLKNGEICRVISTSLIEAGVDVDFPSVYRQMDALDSIVQAAGRCNREGKRSAEESIVYVFSFVGDTGTLRTREKEVTQQIIKEYDDISSPEAITAYFDELHSIVDKGLDKKGIFDFLNEFPLARFYYKRLATMLKIIEDETKAIFIPIDSESKKLEKELRAGIRNRDLFRRISAYSVNVFYKSDNGYESAYEKLIKNNKIELLDENVNILIDEESYDNDTGLLITDFVGGVGEFI